MEPETSGSASPAEIADRFVELGAVFVRPTATLIERLRTVSALVFDWDGVFNRGEKGEGIASGFAEADSMGLNLLRYAFWRRDGRLPVVAIVTGERNPSAEHFARREHLHAVYFGAKDKCKAMAHFQDKFAIGPQGIGCVFDDINDLAMANECGIRILVRRRASAMLSRYMVATGSCDYVTASQSGEYAVREAAELILGLTGSFAEVLVSRVSQDEAYRAYFRARQAVVTDVMGDDRSS